jgi:nicotinate-nucleotide adenylyltransferase
MIVGLYGGAFDPVHNGHLALIDQLLASVFCDKLMLVPTYHSPLKNKSSATPLDRVKMLELVLGSNPLIDISDIEIKRPSKSWTIDTIIALTEMYPETKFKLIMGQDNLETFSKWKNYLEILEMVSLIVVPRGVRELTIPEYLNGRCEVVDDFSMPQSSSAIREALSNGADVKADVPTSVLEYIRVNKLYSLTV